MSDATLEPAHRAELDGLLGKLCDGALGPEEIARLQTLLRTEAAQERYAEYMLLHEALRSELAPVHAAPLVAASAPRQPSRRPRWVVSGAVTALAAAAAITLHLARRDPPERQGVAVVTRAAAARWSAAGQEVAIGAPLPPGPLVLEAGLAQLDFYSGASLVLEAPAHIELVDDRHARLHAGKLRSRVPEHAKGLKISLASGDVVDLGTEFAIEATPGGPPEVHVFEGAVEWHGGGKITRLGKGEAVRLGGPAPRPIAADDRAFADPTRLASAASEDLAARSRHWTTRRAALLRDPALLLYFDFQDAGPWGHAVSNHATVPDRAGDGAIVGCRAVPGRFPEKRALEFKRPSDRVLVNLPGQQPSFSIATWVRFDGLDHKFNAIVHTDDWTDGDLHTHIQPNGQIELHRHGWKPLASTSRIGREDLGRFVHLAWTWDGPGGRAAFYIDGRLDATMSFDPAPPITFGSTQIGNWNREHRNLNGQLDELVILGRPLTAEEVAVMAGAGGA